MKMKLLEIIESIKENFPESKLILSTLKIQMTLILNFDQKIESVVKVRIIIIILMIMKH